MQISRNKKRAGIVGGAVGALMVGMAAFAAFTGLGNFAAGGNVHDAPVALAAAGGSIEQMYPGRCSDVTVTFSNPNDHAAKVDVARLNTATISATLNGQPSNLLAFNPNIAQVLTQAAQQQASLEVPAGGTQSYTLPNLLCLSQSADNTVASQPVALSGSAPFVFDTESEYTN